ncbi:DUF6253 family protein [Streptomyces longwoodensis]|uniref:DUF6253 family protein n=1 Tax=Streptomyces longwoodensis TaxID=68231 RepID=UPI0033DD53A5
MSLVAADGHVALFTTPEGDSYSLPLVCWRDDGTGVHGLVLHRGALRQAELVPGFRRYAHGSEAAPSFAPGEPQRRLAGAAG